MDAKLEVKHVYDSEDAIPPDVLLSNSCDSGPILQVGRVFVELGPKTEWNVSFVDQPTLSVDTHAVSLIPV